MHAPLVRRLLVAAAAALLAACAESPANPSTSPFLDIIPDRATYAAGDLVTVTIHNLSAQRISYSLCAEILARRSGGGWKKLVSGPFTTCDAAILYLDAGASVETQYQLPGALFAGTYRIFYPGIVAPGDVTQVEDHSSSRPFAVAFYIGSRAETRRRREARRHSLRLCASPRETCSWVRPPWRSR